VPRSCSSSHRRYAERVAVAVLDGLPLFTEAESEELLAQYLPLFEPRIDGSHLVSMWGRYHDQFVFFPWYRRELATATRRDVDMPTAHELHEGIMDILRAGPGYSLAYAAAFRYRASEWAISIGCRSCRRRCPFGI
jgi:hypothetical protein